MSLLNADDDQRWVPTHVQVTVLRAKGLRAKGKHGTSDVYTIIQVAKEKFTTCVVEKTTAPEWKEECSFDLPPGVLDAEGRSAYPAGSSDLLLTVMHRALIGPDVFLGQALIPLDKVFQDRICTKNEWYKLNSKEGKKEKERGEVQVTVQFTRNNLTASMYDLSARDKPTSAFGRLKDRMKGKKGREDGGESASAVVPGGFAGASRQRRTRLPSDGGGEEEYEDDEGGEGRRSKMRNFFLRGKLRKSSDTRSSTSLGSESSESSSRGGSLSPTAGISVVVSDLSNSPSETSNLTVDNSPEHTSLPSPNLPTHKRAFSDEVALISSAPPPPKAPTSQSLKAPSSGGGGGARSGSSLCVNGSHVYAADPPPPANSATLGLLQKYAPLSRSLQNLARRSDDPPARPGPGAEGRRWSFDKAAREEKASVTVPVVTVATAAVTEAATEEAAPDGKKQKKNLFSHGRSESAGKGAEQSQAPPPAEEKEKHKGWFGSKDSANKPSPEVSPKVESSSDAVPSHPLTPSPDNHSCTTPPASAAGLASPGRAHLANPFTSPPGTPTFSPSNPFFTRLQCNPFFVDLLGDHALKPAPPTPCLSSSSVWPPTLSSWSDPSSTQDYQGGEPGERSQFVELGTRATESSNPFFTSATSENPGTLEESFEAFARGRVPPSHTTTLSVEPTVGQTSEGFGMFDKIEAGNLSPILTERPTKIPIFRGHQSQRFDWTQEPGINRDLFPPPQIDASPWEKSEEEPGDHAPMQFQEGKTGTDLFSDWNPEKPLDYSLSSPQFVNVSTLIPKSTSAGQPIASPFGRGLGETSGSDVGRDVAGTLAQQEDSTPASAIASHVPEGVAGEINFTWDAPSVFGEEAMHKTDSYMDKVASEAKISAFEPDASPVGANPFFSGIPSHEFPETQLEGLENTTDDLFKPIHEAITEQTSTNSVDLPKITTRAGGDCLNEAYAPIFDSANSVLPNTDTASSLSDTIANNTEINNNSTNELANSRSPLVPEVIMNELNSKKTDSLFSELLESSSPADVVDLPIKADTSSSVSNEGLPQSVSDPTKTAELVAEESLSMAVVGAPDASPVEFGEKDELFSGKVGLELEETPAEHALEKDRSQTPTKLQEPISENLDVGPLADAASDSTLEEGTITLDTPGSYSDLITLGTDPKEAHQESCDEKNGSLNVKDSSGTYAEINESTLSEYLEARECGPPTSPFPDALAFVTAIEDPDPGNGWESLDALSAETGSEHLSLKSAATEKAAPPEEGGFSPFSLGAADSPTAARELVEPEKPHSDSDDSQPPPKPPRVFQDSLPNEEPMNENPQPGLADEAESKPPGTRKDSPTDIFQPPEVRSGPDFLQALPSPLLSETESALLSAAPDVGWEKTDAKYQNTTFTVIKDEPSSQQGEVLRSGFSAFDLEENSDQSWLTSKVDFKVKELDTSNFVAWSADEENAIRTDSTFLDKAILMEDSTEGESPHVLDVGTQPNMSTESCSPTQKLNEGLEESFLDQLKGSKPWTESVEPTWQSLPSLSELCSTVSQDLVRDLAPEDLLKPQIEEEKQQALKESHSDPALFPRPSNLLFGPDLISLPMGVGSAIGLNVEPPAEAPSTLKSLPPFDVNTTSSLFLHDCNPQGSSTPSLLAETNAQLAFLPSPILPLPPEKPTTDTAQASSIAPPSNPPALIDTPFMLLPLETHSADGPPSGPQSSPHPVKPLNASAPQEEKKGEGRSVLVSGLEKLKSTIHPGRAAQSGEPEADKSKASSEGVDRYFHLSHNELVAQLLQREAELEKRGAEFERQGALLEKREAELKKMKAQTRDLEDYIDRLLVRIMEQTPTLLQVRTKLK